MFRTDIDYSEKLKSVLISEDKTLTEIHEVQKIIRSSVNERNWNDLQNNIISFENLSNEFALLEEERLECFDYFGLKDGAGLSSSNNKFTHEATGDIQELYLSVKQKLLASKIENNSLNNYIKITTEFLQGVFDNVIPQRKTSVYSRNGSLVKNQPQSMILNTIL